MKTIKNEVINELIINKSKFITILTNVNNLNEINQKIKSYKEAYKDATHYCYGYITFSSIKCSDDGEPSGTAGMPILNVLEKNDLNNVLCVVIRYFGGIKLGAGGLVRAYSKCAKEALNKTEITNLINGYLIEILFDYDNTKFIDNLLKNIEIEKTFLDKVKYSFTMSTDKYNEIESNLEKNCQIIKKESILFKA